MIKKLIVTTLAVGVIAGVTLGRDAFSYLSTACHRASESVTDAVPIEFQIDRARQMVGDLAPEVRRSMRVIAKEEIALDRLNERITEAQQQAQKSKSEILRLSADLESNRSVFRYAGHNYSREEVSEDLTRRFTRHKVSDETLTHLREMRDARQRNLDAARQKLTAMVAAQKKLETDITNLEAKRNLVAVAQSSSDLKLDDSQLARAKELITDIRTRLDVAARLANADVAAPGEIVLDKTESTDVAEQVAAYFDVGGGGEGAALVAKHSRPAAVVNVLVD